MLERSAAFISFDAYNSFLRQFSRNSYHRMLMQVINGQDRLLQLFLFPRGFNVVILLIVRIQFLLKDGFGLGAEMKRTDQCDSQQVNEV